MYGGPWNVLRFYHRSGYTYVVSLDSLYNFSREPGWKKSWNMPMESYWDKSQLFGGGQEYPLTEDFNHNLPIQFLTYKVIKCVANHNHLCWKPLITAIVSQKSSVFLPQVFLLGRLKLAAHQIWTWLIWNAAPVARRAGVRTADRPNTETSVFALSQPARSGAKFVYTEMWALSGKTQLQLGGVAQLQSLMWNNSNMWTSLLKMQ